MSQLYDSKAVKKARLLSPDATLVLPDLHFHHIGVAARSIAQELPLWGSLGYAAKDGPFTDPAQGVRGIFLYAPGAPTLELLENLCQTGPLTSYLQRGVKFYHFAYETPDIEAAATRLCAERKAKIIIPAMPAAYFAQICFVMLPQMSLIELIQREHIK